MAFEELDDVAFLLGPAPSTQQGPLRFMEMWKTCGSRNCRVQTYYRVSGIPYCMTHALRKLNEMLIERGVEQ